MFNRKPSQKIFTAYANGVRTAAEYARYIKRNKARTNKVPKYINDMLLEASQCG